jgi:hypothetical protein
MGLAEIQAALARLYVDRALRQQFFERPDEIGAAFGLRRDEAESLARTPRAQVERYAASLLRKRRAQVRRLIPLAARAIGDTAFERLFESYAVQAPPRGSKADLADGAGFLAAIQSRATDIEPPWAADLAQYELAWLQAQRSGCIPILRIFCYPVGLLLAGRAGSPVGRRFTLAIWWRPRPHFRVSHLVFSAPLFLAQKRR